MQNCVGIKIKIIYNVCVFWIKGITEAGCQIKVAVVYCELFLKLGLVSLDRFLDIADRIVI